MTPTDRLLNVAAFGGTGDSAGTTVLTTEAPADASTIVPPETSTSEARETATTIPAAEATIRGPSHVICQEFADLAVILNPGPSSHWAPR